MSSAERAARLIMEMEPGEFRVLQAIELGMAGYSFVPLDEVVKYSGLKRGETVFRLRALDRKDLLYRQPEPYPGYILNYTAYDCLALNALAKADLLSSLGRSLGVGKEADIFDAITDDDVQVAVKFHRLGRTSFRDTRRKRGYVARRGHITWHHQSRLAAEKEFSFMSKAHEAGVAVPEPLKQNRHVVVMGFIDGYNLFDVKLDDPSGFLEDILLNVKLTYGGGVIHGDLSEFNIVVQKDGQILFIDWPQAVPVDHQSAEALLRRDVENVLTYFRRKYKVERGLDEVLEYVRGRSGPPALEKSDEQR
jgi:RIO kinase 2